MFAFGVWLRTLLAVSFGTDTPAGQLFSGVMQVQPDNSAEAFVGLIILVLVIAWLFGGSDSETSPPGDEATPGQPLPADPSVAAAISLVGSETGNDRLEALTDVARQLPNNLPADVVVELLGDLTDVQRLKGIRMLAGKIQRPASLEDADRIINGLTGSGRREARRLLLS